MPQAKTTSFIAELSNLMDKYDVNFVIDENINDDCINFYLVQNDWEPIDIPYDWRTGEVNADIIRKLKIES